MKSVVLLLLLSLLVGCAAPIYKINLQTYTISTFGNNVSVIDSRLDNEVYITGLSVAGTHIYIYEVNPTLTEVLSSSIQLSLALEGRAPESKVTVSIEELDIKNKVGFATRDQLSCIIESKVLIGSSEEETIKTLSRNDENMSPMVTTSGKLIVDQCIKDHGRDIAEFLTASG